jgi:hypothetical protein
MYDIYIVISRVNNIFPQFTPSLKSLSALIYYFRPNYGLEDYVIRSHDILKKSAILFLLCSFIFVPSLVTIALVIRNISGGAFLPSPPHPAQNDSAIPQPE